MSYKEVQDVLNSQEIYTSSYLPLPFLQRFKRGAEKKRFPYFARSDKSSHPFRIGKGGTSR